MDEARADEVRKKQRERERAGKEELHIARASLYPTLPFLLVEFM